MRLICLSVVIVFLGVVQIRAATSPDGFGYELMISLLETMHSNDGKNAAKMDQFMHVIVGEPSCPEHADNGVYKLKPIYSNSPPFSAYCEEGWIVIYRRFKGDLNMSRTFHDYRAGFGDIQGDYWLGLEKMHQITRGGSYELMVVLKNSSGVEKRSTFEGFKISSEFEQYQLGLTSFIAGDAGDNIMKHSGMVFFKDICETRFFLSWASNCFQTNRIIEIEYVHMDSWYNFVEDLKSFKEARMMIRAVVSRE